MSIDHWLKNIDLLEVFLLLLRLLLLFSVISKNFPNQISLFYIDDERCTGTKSICYFSHRHKFDRETLCRCMCVQCVSFFLCWFLQFNLGKKINAGVRDRLNKHGFYLGMIFPLQSKEKKEPRHFFPLRQSVEC